MKHCTTLLLVLAMALVAPDGSAAVPSLDEMETEWIRQDGPIPTNQTHAAWRAARLQRRAARLAPVVAMARQWVYCRHYVVSGGRATFMHLSELSDAFEQRGYLAVGSSLCLATYSPDGLWREETLLSSKLGCYRDVDVSPDGKRILYSFKASDRGDDFHLYEMDLASRKVRQLTFGLGAADIEGCYLPDGCILFNSTRCGQIVDCWWNEVFNLYRCDADGSHITRITYDQVNDYYPTLQDDGRVFYMRWEYNDRGQIYTQPVFSMNPDGTYQRALYGGNSFFPNSILNARKVPGSPLFFAIGTGHHSWEPGELMRFDPRAGREETSGCWEVAPLRPSRFVKRDGDFGQQGEVYCYPYPVNEESVVISHRRNRGDRHHAFGLCWTDVHGARELLVAQNGKISCGRPVPVCARQLPSLPSRRPDETRTTGTISIADVYVGESMKGVPRGLVKSLRVVALSYRPAGIGRSVMRGPGGFGMNATPPGAGNTTWMVKKVMGEVPVAADGSVALELPARTPFYFQLLDEKGRMVQTMRSWTLLQPGEHASCVGCHESANDAPDFHRALAPAKVASSLPLPRDGFSFMHEVQPILERRCVHCHNPSRRGTIPDLTATSVRDLQAKRWWTQSYVALTHARYGDSPYAKRFVGTSMWWENLWVADCSHPLLNWVDGGSTAALAPPLWRGSRESRLFTEKLDRGHAPGITDAELRTLTCWVDLGVPFCGAYDERTDWSAADHEFWNRALVRRTRFRTQGEPAGNADYAWSVQGTVPRATTPAELRRTYLRRTAKKAYGFILQGSVAHPETVTLAEGVLNLENDAKAQFQCGFDEGDLSNPATGARATFNQTGGDFRVGDYAVVGRYARDIGWLNLTGGTFRMLNRNCCLFVGEEGEGHLRVGGTAQLTVPTIVLGKVAGSRNSTVTLEANGLICTGAMQARGTGASITFDGGTLETYWIDARYNDFLPTNATLRVKAGGVCLHVTHAAHAVVRSPFLEDATSPGGGLVKRGDGILELAGASTFTGETRIEGGLLFIAHPQAVAKCRRIEVAGLAAFGVRAEDLVQANRLLRNRMCWKIGSRLVVDVGRGDVEVPGDAFLGASVVEKIGSHNLILTSPLKGVVDLQVRGGQVKEKHR